ISSFLHVVHVLLTYHATTEHHSPSLHDALPILASTLAEDYDLVLHGRNPEKAPEGVDLKIAELDDYQQVLALMDGIDTVVHMARSEEHTSELQSRFDLVCRLLLV